MSVDALDAGVGGQAIALIGGASTRSLSDRLAAAGARVVEGAPLQPVPATIAGTPVTGWVVTLEHLSTAQIVADRLTDLAAALQETDTVRRVVVVVVDASAAAAAVARTAAIYATVHTLDRDVRINVVVTPPGTDADARDVTLAFLSGRLDAVRGQTFVVQTPEAA